MFAVKLAAAQPMGDGCGCRSVSPATKVAAGATVISTVMVSECSVTVDADAVSSRRPAHSRAACGTRAVTDLVSQRVARGREREAERQRQSEGEAEAEREAESWLY